MPIYVNFLAQMELISSICAKKLTHFWQKTHVSIVLSMLNWFGEVVLPLALTCTFSQRRHVGLWLGWSVPSLHVVTFLLL